MKFTLEIECDNAAFDDDATVEIARILRKLAKEMTGGAEYFESHWTLRDVNGNRVGQAVLHE